MKRALIIVLVGRLIQMAVMLATLRAATTRLSTVELGNFSLLASLSTFFVWILISPLGPYLNRFTLDWRGRGTIWINYLRMAAYVVAVAAFTATTIYLWKLIFKPAWTLQLSWLGTSMAAYIIFSTFNTVTIPAINLFGRRVAYTLLYSATQILCLAFSWFITGIEARGEYWFLGQTAGFALGFLLALPLFTKTTSPEKGQHWRTSTRIRDGLKAVAIFCLPIVVTNGLFWVQFQSYRIVVGNLVSLEFLGLFFAGYSVSAGLLAAVEVATGQFFGPYFYKHVQEAVPGREQEGWAAYMSLLYPMIIVIVMAVIAVATPATHLLLAPKFWTASTYVAAGAVVEGIRVLCGGYSLATHVSKRTHALLLPHVIGATTTLITLLGGTWLFGDAAVGPAMIFSAFVFLAAMHLILTRHAGTSPAILGWPWVLAASLLMAALMLLKSHLSIQGVIADLGFVVAVGLVLGVALLMILRAARPLLLRFAR